MLVANSRLSHIHKCSTALNLARSSPVCSDLHTTHHRKQSWNRLGSLLKTVNIRIFVANITLRHHPYLTWLNSTVIVTASMNGL
jgi:hypothetical protein